MLILNQRTTWVRGALAVSLALFFSFDCFAVLAAQSLNSASAMACCRKKAKCSCHKMDEADPGVTIAARSCGDACVRVTLGSVSITAFVTARDLAVSPALSFSARTRVGELFAPPFFSSHNLLQRPPPPFLSAY